jgi:hypothetical protein
MRIRLVALDHFAALINGDDRDLGNIMRIAGKWVLAKDHEVCLCTDFYFTVSIFFVVLIGDTVGVKT